MNRSKIGQRTGRWEHRTSPRSTPRQSTEPRSRKAAIGNRAELVKRAKRRLASGFYDLPECMDIALDAMLKATSKWPPRPGVRARRFRPGRKE